MNDGLATTEIRATSLITALGSVSTTLTTGTLAASSSEIGADEIAASAVTTDKIATAAVTSIKQKFVGIGSPSAGGVIVQAGEYGPMVGGSQVISFGTKFSAAPYVVAAPKNMVAATQDTAGVGWVTAGSFVAMGSPATGSFTWVAVGSGAL